jgi:outer membrane receptor for ferrienterochelin and colicins
MRETGSLRAIVAVAGLLSTSALVAPGAMAQAADDDSGFVLDPVVVTASGFQQTVTDAPASISVIPGDQLRNESFRDLADAVRHTQGVSVIGNANEQDISIRGLPGSYTLILVDGVRQGTRNARPNGSAGSEQSFIPPAVIIDRIEVLRGPASTLYGSDAVGGVINIITKKVSDVPTGSFGLSYTKQQHDKYGDDMQAQAYVAGPLIENRLGYQLWGTAFGRGEDEILEGSNERENYQLAGRLTFTPNEQNAFMLDAGTERLQNRSTPGKSTAGETGLERHNDRSYVRLSHEGTWDWGTSFLSAQREVGERTTFALGEEDPRSPEITNIVLDGRATVPLGDHMVSFGTQYIKNTLNDQNPGMRNEVDYDFSLWQAALYVEDEWAATDRLTITGGLRMDYHSEYGDHYSPRLYAVYGLTDQVTIKGGVSTGFRAPEIRSIVPGYAYATGGSGCFYGPESELPEGMGPCGVILANPDLKPETSTNFEAAVIYDNLEDLTLGATVFHTELKNQVNNERVYNDDGSFARWDQDPNYTLFRQYNLNEARMQGVELTALWEATSTLRLTANYTYIDSEQKTGTYAGLPLNRTPEHSGSVRADWVTPVEGLSSYLAGNYIGDQINAGLRIGENGSPIYRDGEVVARKYDGYFTADIGASYALTDSVALNGAVYNVFDKQVGPDEVDDVVAGRRFWLGLTATF